MSRVPAHPRFDHPIRLAEGFDPTAWPELNPPVPGVRPWRWLADRGTAESDLAGYLAEHVKGHGTVDGTDKELMVRPRSRDEVVRDFLEQGVRFALPGLTTELSLTAVPEGDAASSDAEGPGATQRAGGLPTFPFTGPVAIVGTTAPPVSGEWAIGRNVGEELADFYAGRGVEAWDAVAVDRQRDWVERALVVSFSDPGMVIIGAEAHGQPYLAVWRPDPDHLGGVVEVVDVERGPSASVVVALGVAVSRRVTATTCPLIPGSRCGDLCKLYGGPWVSRSMIAAMRWEARRARMIRALGCDTCGDGAIKIFQNRVAGSRRQAIPIRPDRATPTRFVRLVNEGPETAR